MDTPNQGGSKSNTLVGIVVAIIVIVALGAWWYFSKGNTAMTGTEEEITEPMAPEEETQAIQEETQAVNEELKSIDTGDINQEFESIDADLNNL